jgi:hypothetical protein
MSSSGGHREEDPKGSYFVNSARSAIKALSSGRFLTPSSSALTSVVDGRNGAEKSDRERFADELALAMGTGDVKESMEPAFEVPHLERKLSEVILAFPGQERLSEVTSVFPGGVIGEDEKRLSTFGPLRAMYGSETGDGFSGQEMRSLFAAAPNSAPVSRSRSPQTPPHVGGARMRPYGCERYELKIDYVVIDQVYTWSHY